MTYDINDFQPPKIDKTNLNNRQKELLGKKNENGFPLEVPLKSLPKAIFAGKWNYSIKTWEYLAKQYDIDDSEDIIDLIYSVPELADLWDKCKQWMLETGYKAKQAQKYGANKFRNRNQ